MKDIYNISNNILAKKGNDIENISSPSKRATFKAIGDLSVPGQVHYDQLTKDNYAYQGIQAEILATNSEMSKDGDLLQSTLKERSNKDQDRIK